MIFSYRTLFKRLLDVFICLVFFMLSFWLLIGLALVYVVSFQFPIFFKQERIGKDGKSFWMYKFRTLAKDLSMNLQQRRFWLGDFMRFFSLDELPQLWHVLKGEMSVVGPRPLPTAYLILMSEEQKKRHSVRPGITGWTQINGRHAIDWKNKFELDLYYVHHISFILDLKIIFKTILLLISLKKDQSLVEKKFEGNT